MKAWLTLTGLALPPTCLILGTVLLRRLRHITEPLFGCNCNCVYCGIHQRCDTRYYL